MKNKTLKAALLTIISACILLSLSACSANKAQKATKSHHVDLVASTNIYADIAKNVLGKYGKVTAIISNGDTDPHDFEPNVNSAKAVAGANIVLANGLGYDSWMDNLAASNNIRCLKVGEDLLAKKKGDNPHIWYDLDMPGKLVPYLVKRASQIDPAHHQYFQQRGQDYLKKIAKIKRLAAEINGRQQKEVFVSEPVFDYALDRCHFKIGNKEFEKAIENETDPEPAVVQQMRTQLRHHQVAFFVDNVQASSTTVKNFISLANQEGIPVLKVRETMPNGSSYADWMLANYRKLAQINSK